MDIVSVATRGQGPRSFPFLLQLALAGRGREGRAKLAAGSAKARRTDQFAVGQPMARQTTHFNLDFGSGSSTTDHP